MDAARRKAPNPNKDPELLAEKKAAKAERDKGRKRADEIKRMSWKYGLGSAAVIIGLLCTYSLFTISRATIVAVQLDDATQLKEVFFGGEPWMLQCADENVTIGAGFLGASKRMSVTSSSKVNFGTIDCNGKLPSNKTFWQRFGQTPKAFSAAAPVGFLFANNNDPVAIPDKYINDAKKLSDWAEKYRHLMMTNMAMMLKDVTFSDLFRDLRIALCIQLSHEHQPSVQELSWTKTFKKHCLSRDACVQLHTKGKFKVPSWFRGVMAKHRGLKFVSINRKLHKTSFDSVVRAPRTDDTAKVAVMQRVKQGDAFRYTLTAHKGDFTEDAVRLFIEDVAVKASKSKDTVTLEEPIWFDTPPKDQKGGGGAKKQQRRSTGSSSGGSSSQGSRERPQGGEQQEQRQEGKREQESRRDKTSEDRTSEAEKARLDAARQAEEQLAGDDDVVVSDIEEDDDDGLV